MGMWTEIFLVLLNSYDPPREQEKEDQDLLYQLILFYIGIEPVHIFVPYW